MRRHLILEPGTRTYRLPKRDLPPDYEQRLRRLLERRDAWLRETFPQYFDKRDEQRD